MTRRLTTLALLGALFAARPALADDTADEAEFRFRHAAELYSKARFDEALGEFFASNRLAHNKNVVYNIARCFEQIGRLNEAFRFYSDLVPEKWSPEDRAGLEAAIEKLKPKLALLRVETEPPGADVYVDRQDLGSRGLSPRTLALPTGPATVFVELAGFRAAPRAVTLEKGREAKVVFVLDRIYGRVRVRSDPAGAQVRVDRPDAEPACDTPCELKVLPGRRVLHFGLAGHLPTRSEVEVGPDGTVAVEVRLPPVPPPTGKLVVTANKDGALVTIDGVESGFTPAVLDAVVAGPHRVAVAFEDYETWTGEAVVQTQRTATLRARLSVPAPQVAAASKSLTSSAEAPASVTVITAEEIRAFGYRTLTDALRPVRGLYVTNDGIYDQIGIRGFQPPGDVNTRVLLLIDGHTYNEAWTGQSSVGFDLDVDLSQVERIEVVRGPASALYGSSAVFGVVNVVHRTAPRQGNVEVLATGGNNGTVRARVTAGFDRGEGQPSAMLSVAGLDAAGRDTQVLAGNLPDGRPQTLHGGDQEQAAHASAHARVGDFSLLASYNRRPKTTRLGVWGTTVGADTTAVDTRAFAEGRWEHALGAGAASARVYADYLRYGASSAYGDPTVELDGANWAGAEVRVRSAPLLGVHVLGLGLDYQRWFKVFQHIALKASGQDQLADERTSHVANAYLTEDWRLGPRACVQAAVGVRLGKTATARAGAGTPEEPLAVNFNPRLALVLKPYEGGLTKVLAGRAFRAPSIYERYYQDNGTSQLPSTDLGPETIYTVEVEHSHRLTDEVLATAAVFGNRLTDVINLNNVTAAPGQAPNLLRFENGRDARWAFGGEVEVRWQPTRLTLVSFAYSFQHSRDPSTAGKQPLVNSPAHLAALRAMYPLLPGVTLAGEATYGAPRLASDGAMVGEALLVNTVVSGDLPRSGLQYALAAYNLLNESYSYPASSGATYAAIPQLGRLVQVTLGKSF